MLGIGIGGTAEKAMVLAKESLMDPIDMHELIQRGPRNKIEALRIELYNKVNELGIGAQGLGGLTTVLDVKILDFPTHAANLPIAMIPNCAATRHLHIHLDGSGPVAVAPPSLDAWPKLEYSPQNARRVNLDTVTHADTKTWKPGEVILLSGKLLTGRDAAHKRMRDMLNRGGQKRVRRFEAAVGFYVAPAHLGAEPQTGPIDMDPGQIRNLAQVDQHVRGREAKIHDRHEALAARDHLSLQAGAAQKFDCFVQRRRADIVEAGRLHLASPIAEENGPPQRAFKNLTMC